MSIETKRPSPFGEKMTEKHCQLLGHIGQISIMIELGRMLEEKEGKIPGTSPEGNTVRSLCRTLYGGEFLDVAYRFNADTATTTTETTIAYKLGMTRRNAVLGREALTAPAMNAFRFHAGVTNLVIPSEFVTPFRKVVTFYEKRAYEEISLRAAASPSDCNAVIEPIGRSGGDITYEVKYLEPSLGNGAAS